MPPSTTRPIPFSTEEWALQLAWEVATHVRTCPPPSLLPTHTSDSRVARHLAGCEACSERIGADTQEQMERSVARLRSSIVGLHLSPKVGQVWSIGANLGGWDVDETRYFNPPLILITEIVEDDVKVIRAVQIFHDLTFQGPGDVELPAEIGGFAEAWNEYPLAAEFLDTCWGAVGPEVIEAVCSGASDDTYLDEGSLLHHFRSLEVEVAYHFAKQALDVVLPITDNPAEDSWLDRARIVLHEVGAQLSAWWTPPLVGAYAAGGGVYQKVDFSRAGHSGSVVLEIDNNGRGEIRGQFDHPSELTVRLFDLATGSLASLVVNESHHSHLTLKAGFASTRFWVRLQPDTQLKMLIDIEGSIVE